MPGVPQMPVPAIDRTKHQPQPLPTAGADRADVIDGAETDLFFADIALFPVGAFRSGRVVLHKKGYSIFFGDQFRLIH